MWVGVIKKGKAGWHKEIGVTLVRLLSPPPACNEASNSTKNFFIVIKYGRLFSENVPAFTPKLLDVFIHAFSSPLASSFLRTIMPVAHTFFTPTLFIPNQTPNMNFILFHILQLVLPLVMRLLRLGWLIFISQFTSLVYSAA